MYYPALTAYAWFCHLRNVDVTAAAPNYDGIPPPPTALLISVNEKCLVFNFAYTVLFFVQTASDHMYEFL
jgi:hypothetical protein